VKAIEQTHTNAPSVVWSNKLRSDCDEAKQSIQIHRIVECTLTDLGETTVMSCTQRMATSGELTIASGRQRRYRARGTQNSHKFGLGIPRNLGTGQGFVDGSFRLRSAKVSRPGGVNAPDAERDVWPAARAHGLYNAEGDQIGVYQNSDHVSIVHGS
jgi:hypothetical protein